MKPLRLRAPRPHRPRRPPGAPTRQLLALGALLAFALAVLGAALGAAQGDASDDTVAGLLQRLHAEQTTRPDSGAAAPSPEEAHGDAQEAREAAADGSTSTPGVMRLPGAPQRPAGPEAGAGIERIGIERGPCLVGCPVYTFTVARDGTFRYHGEANVERLGAFRGTVSVGRLKQVLAFIDEIDFDALQRTYASEFLDNPTVYTLVQQDGEARVVAHEANSGPARLWALEQLIDSLLATAEWRPAAGE